MAVSVVSATDYVTDSPSVTLTTGANRVVALCFASGGNGSVLTAATLDGEAAENLEAGDLFTGGEEAVLGAADWPHPGPGSYTLTSTWSGVSSVSSKIYVVYELSDAGAITGFVVTKGGSQSNNFTISQNLSSATDELALAFACAADDSNMADNGGSDDAGNLANVVAQKRDKLQVCAGADLVVAASPTTYRFLFSDSALSGGTYDRSCVAALYVTASAGGSTEQPAMRRRLLDPNFRFIGR